MVRRSYWLFQAKDELNDLKQDLEKLADAQGELIVPWRIDQYKKMIQDGDVVYLWRAGTDAGVYGWGVVCGDAEPDSEEPEQLRAPVEYRAVVDPPLLRPELREQGDLEGLGVLRRVPHGTNFGVRYLEAEVLNGMLATRGSEAPPNPHWIDVRRWTSEARNTLDNVRGIVAAVGAARAEVPSARREGLDMSILLLALYDAAGDATRRHFAPVAADRNELLEKLTPFAADHGIDLPVDYTAMPAENLERFDLEIDRMIDHASSIAFNSGVRAVSPVHLLRAALWRTGNPVIAQLRPPMEVPELPIADEERVPTLFDDPAQVDELGRLPFAEVVALRINEVWKSAEGSKIGKTFSVHIHGPWGAGKTSVLNFIRDLLTSENASPQWVVVEFNAWRQQRLRPPWWSLIREVYRGGLRQLPWLDSIKLRWTWMFWRLRADLLPVVIATTLIAITAFLVVEIFSPSATPDETGAGRELPVEAPAAAESAAEVPQGASNTTEATPSEWINAAKQIELSLKIIVALAAAFGAVVLASRSLLFGSSQAAQRYLELSRDPMRPIIRLFKKVIATMGRPVSVFIDDLDRCDGDYVVDLLEGIQTLFREANVTYVVAADRDWIRVSFEKRYEDFAKVIEEPGRPLGFLFLDKLFQVSVSIPSMSGPARARYLRRILEISGSPEEMKRATETAEEQAEKLIGDSETEQELKGVIDSFQGDELVLQSLRAVAAKRISAPIARRRAEHFLQGFADRLEPNPRAMKRLVNAYGLHQAINFLEERDVDPEPLALWTIIELRWPLLVDFLSRNPEEVGASQNDVDVKFKDLYGRPEVRGVLDGLDAASIRSIVGAVAIEASGGRH